MNGTLCHVAAEATIALPPTIAFNGVDVAFPSRDGSTTQALSGFALSIRPGEIFSLVGPSGCGKSTALRLAAGLIEPTRGTVHTAGRKKRGFDEVAIAFQKPLLLPWFSVLDNVLYPVRMLRRVVGRAERDRALELLGSVGLDDCATRSPDELSGGMQQRAALCRALVLDPAVLLMDEPFGALDALTREELQFDLLRIHRRTKKTILLVTHSISEAVLLSDRVGVMTARPGRLHNIVPIDLPRRRDAEVLASPNFVTHAREIRNLIFGHRAASLAQEEFA